MFGAGIDITTYVPPCGSGSVIFTPNQAGNFYYVCTFPGHIALGMWGNIVVESVIPEFPSASLAVFVTVAVTTLVVYGTVKLKTYKNPLMPSF